MYSQELTRQLPSTNYTNILRKESKAISFLTAFPLITKTEWRSSVASDFSYRRAILDQFNRSKWDVIGSQSHPWISTKGKRHFSFKILSWTFAMEWSLDCNGNRGRIRSLI